MQSTTVFEGQSLLMNKKVNNLPQKILTVLDEEKDAY